MTKPKSQTVYGDVKFHSQMPFTSVDVCFRDRRELEEFIANLTQLLESNGSATQKVVLSDYSHREKTDPPPEEGLPSDVCFHAPGHARDEIDQRCLGAARSHLLSLIEGD